MYQQDSRTTIQSALQTEIQTPSFQRKFNRFKKAHKQFRRFNTPQELVKFFQMATSPEAGRNDRNRWLHLMVSDYQKNPKRKPWLMSLLLLAQWKQMEGTFYRFGFDQLNLVNPFDPFAPVYESYIDAFLDVKQRTARKFSLHLKDHAEYLIRKELKEYNRFTGECEQEIPAPENLPWPFEIEQMIEEWQRNGILSRRQANLVIDHLIDEFTFREISKREKVSPETVSKRFQRALKTLKPYLQRKYFSEDGKILRR